jgi:hypothetical protein
MQHAVHDVVTLPYPSPGKQTKTYQHKAHRCQMLKTHAQIPHNAGTTVVQEKAAEQADFRQAKRHAL